jgi:glycosyltransferase involved in cell wall biosynthesis
MNKPRVSIIMPVYNSERYLQEAMESILYQTFADFEFIIINDGSTDNSLSIIKSYSDDRIKYYENNKNFGLIHTLNIGLDKAIGEFICRMDADDISRSDRLERQVKYLDQNTDVDILGSYYQLIPSNHLEKQPVNHENCRIKLLFNTCIGHPTVMMRKKTVDRLNLRYDPQYKHVEDYFMWSEAVLKGARLSNIDLPLLYYRTHNTQISSIFREQQNLLINKIRWQYAIRSFDVLKPEDEQLYIKFLTNHNVTTDDYFKIKKLIRILIKQNEISNFFEKIYFKKAFRQQLKRLAKTIYPLKTDDMNFRLIPCLFKDYYFYKYFFRRSDKHL